MTDTREWYKLTPDINGSYVNGTWSQLASLQSNYGPLFFASAVLADGKVIIEGGEQNFSQYVWTTMGAMYDPLANTWTSINPPSGWSTIGDASGIVLPNKTFMLANCCTTQTALFNESTMTWTSTGSGKFDSNDEEGWVLLPNGKVLAVDAYTNVNDPTGTNSELYDPSSGAWTTAGSTVAQLWDPYGSYEEGPGVLRPDGTVFWTCAPTVKARVTLPSIAPAHKPGCRNLISPAISMWPTALRPCSRTGTCWSAPAPASIRTASSFSSGMASQSQRSPRSTEFSVRLVLVWPDAGTADRTDSLHRRQHRCRGLHLHREPVSGISSFDTFDLNDDFAGQHPRSLRL